MHESVKCQPCPMQVNPIVRSIQRTTKALRTLGRSASIARECRIVAERHGASRVGVARNLMFWRASFLDPIIERGQ